MIAVYKISQEQVLDYWPEMRDFLEKGLAAFDQHDLFPLDMVLRDLLLGDAQGWLATKDDMPICAVATRINSYPKGDAVLVWLMGGEYVQSWCATVHNAIVKYADEIGAKWVETNTRRGMGKLFQESLGYKRKHENYLYGVR